MVLACVVDVGLWYWRNFVPFPWPSVRSNPCRQHVPAVQVPQVGKNGRGPHLYRLCCQSRLHCVYACTVLARLYTPPFCIVVRRKRRGLIEVCSNAPSLRPPHPTLQSGFRVTVMLLRGSCRVSWLPQKPPIIIVHNSQQLQTRDGRIVCHVSGKNFLVHSSVTCRITDVRR